MTPIDDELRTALHERASQVSSSPDPLTGIERRAKGIRRRRVAAAVTGSALALAAVAVAVPTISGALDADGKPSPGNFAGPQPTDTITPSDTATPSESASPIPGHTALPTTAAVPGWPYVGMNTIADGANRIAMAEDIGAAMSQHWPGAEVTLTGLHPLYGGISGSDQLILVAAAEVTGNADAPGLVAAAWVKPTNGPATLVGLHDIAPDAAQVSVFVPAVGQPASGQRTGTAVVVGQPGTGQIELQAPSSQAWQPIEDAADGRAVAFTIGMPPAGDPVPQIRVLDGDGDLDHPLYEGPIGQGITFPDV